MEDLSDWLNMIKDAVGNGHPGLLFLAMVLLPLVGVPVSPLWIAAGVRLGAFPAFAFSMVALLLNFTAGYWLARCGRRARLIHWVGQRGWQIPQLSTHDETLAILMLRVTPGVPLCVQNYLLGLAGARFGRYLVFSMPAQAPYALAFVWLGDSLASNAIWHLFLALAALAGLAMLVSLLRRRMKTRAPAMAYVTPNRRRS